MYLKDITPKGKMDLAIKRFKKVVNEYQTTIFVEEVTQLRTSL